MWISRHGIAAACMTLLAVADSPTLGKAQTDQHKSRVVRKCPAPLCTPTNGAEPDDFGNGGGMRQDIDVLLVEHAQKIAQLKDMLGAALPHTAEYDDIFLLRYVLSNAKRGGLEQAKKSVLTTVKWREENAEKLAECRRKGEAENHDVFNRFQVTGPCGSLGGMEPFLVIRIGFCNPRGLMNTLTHDQVVEYLTVSKELRFMDCDQLTRRTRKLIKMVTICDATSFRLLDGDTRFFKALGEASKLSQDLYPQLLGKTVVINAPKFVRFVWGMLGSFLPKSAIDKIAVCPATGTTLANAPDASTCPFLRRWSNNTDPLATLPDFVGGKLACPAVLQPRQGKSGAEHEVKQVVVNARSCADLRFSVPAGGCTGVWQVLVEDHGICMSAHLWPEGAAGSCGARECVMESTKLKAENGLATGSFALPVAGELIVSFDNTHSLLRSKTLEYHIAVEA